MLLTNGRLATMQNPHSYGFVENGALLVEHHRISWIGSTGEVPDRWYAHYDVLDCRGKLVTPGLIDCHTHLVYAGHRANEFEQRLEGATYQEIANRGGGIVSTVRATREAAEDELYAQSLPRLKTLINEGVTTVEIKSGYGLNTQAEIKMLSVAAKLSEQQGVRIKKTFLGAHAIPPEFYGRKNPYLDLVCHEMLPAAHASGLVDAVDAFCENIAFSVDQVHRLFDTAEHYRLPIKLHAEQLSHLGGAVMAAGRGALSVDHLEYLPEHDVPLIQNGKTVAVLLPGAFYTLKETRLPPIDGLRKEGIPVAVASDCNPGSSPVCSLLLSMNMACTLFGLTPTEALAGVTLNAARALGMEQEVGSIEAGKAADLVIWDTTDPATLSYHIGLNPCRGVMANGHWLKYPE